MGAVPDHHSFVDEVVPALPLTAQQLALYRAALEEIDHNTELLKIGASFDELSNSVLRHTSDVVANRYPCAFHGVGKSDEYRCLHTRSGVSDRAVTGLGWLTSTI